MKSVEKNEPILYDKYLDRTSPGFLHNYVRGGECTMNVILRLRFKPSYKRLWYTYPCTHHEGIWGGGADVWLHLFLTSASDGGRLSA